MNLKRQFTVVAFAAAIGCFLPQTLAQDAMTDVLGVLEQDLNQPFSSPPRDAANDDFSKLALAAANFALATQLEKHGQFTSALAKYRLAAEADPGYLPIHTRMAMVYIKLEKLSQATAFLREKESSFPAAAEIKTILGYLYYRQNQPDQALAYARAAEKLNPLLMANYQLQAGYYLDQGQSYEITPLMARSLTVNTNQSSYYFRLGDLWGQCLYQTKPLTVKEVVKQTLPFYEKAFALAPDNHQLAFHLGQQYFELEDYQSAVACYEQTYQKAPHTPGLRENMSLCYLALKKNEQAIAMLENLLEDYPERKKLYPMIAELYGRIEQWDKAANYYKLHVQLGNPDAQDYTRLANAEIQAQRPADALETLAQAEKLYPEIPDLRLFKALVLRNLERWREALAIFQNLEQQHDKLVDSYFYFNYAATYEKSGDENRAIELFKKCLALNPNNHQALNYLGYMWAIKGEKLDEAEQMIAKALTLDPASPAYLDSMAWVYYQKKQYDKALEYQQQAVAGIPDDPEVLEHLADIYYKLGKTEKAIEAWSKASLKAKDPGSLKAKIQSAKEQLQASLPP